MATIRDLKTRIKAVNNIAKITRAMEMVATTKLKRFQERAVQSRPYTLEIEGLVKNLAAHVGQEEHPLFDAREGKRTGLLVVTSDRGLCGAYNSFIFQKLREFQVESAGCELEYHVIGRKGMSYLRRRGTEVAAYFEDPPLERMGYRDAARIAQIFVEKFLASELDEVKVLYTAFMSMSRYVPTVFRLLPLSGVGDPDAVRKDYILEPSPERIFTSLLPKYLETRMFNMLIESLTSEYASKRISMKNATDAATEMGGTLKLKYNRARQEKITKELLELVGGAEALKG
ncbi:MAG: ATP synthase F1 subunit gamma [Planctomycetota bacterium]